MAGNAEARVARPGAAAPPLRLEWVLAGLAVASVIELLVLRTFTRTAVHIPALSELRDPYEALASFGRYAYYVSAVLLILSLPFAVTRLWGRGDLYARVAAVAVVVFAITAALARADVANVILIDVLTVGVVVMAASAAAARMDPRGALVVGAFAAAFALQGGSAMLQDAASQGYGSYETRWMLWSAEWLALAFAVASPVGFAARPSRLALVLASVAGLVLFAALVANGSTTKILLLWNEGLAGTLPSVAYGVGAAALLATLLGLLAQRRMLALTGFVLLITGGIGLHSTYQTGLVVAGMAALCLAVREVPLARPRVTLSAATAAQESPGPGSPLASSS
ncbi:MAG: hypothetical protein HUU14_07340 [Dehalococcoidia bacterium]|nr:hypothetical protein [Dehalococcoidia bacterium]NUQ55681.1 hypothetical protein [Dehalococcoidia bacterium]